MPRIVLEVLCSPGQPLDQEMRAFMEPRFGHDFSHVRVHTDTKAANSARAVNALAYTVGRDIVFDSGQCAPSTRNGLRLLAHELAHTLQQPTFVATSPATLGVSAHSDPAEDEADRVADAVMNRTAAHDATAQGLDIRTAAPVVGVMPVLRRTPSILQRATRKGCMAPSFVVDTATASVFGTIAETMVEADYLAQKGGKPFADIFLDNPMGPLAYVAFLAAHHPSINKALLAVQIGLSGGVLVPDILDTRASCGSPEFYDVKPDSVDGRAAGRGKLAAIEAFMSYNTLPYIRGSTYSPTPAIPIPLAGTVLISAINAVTAGAVAIPALTCGLPIVTLSPKRAANGLLLYEVCVEADLDCYLKILALEALIAAVIIAVIATEGAAAPVLVPAAGAAAAVIAGPNVAKPQPPANTHFH